MAAEVDREAWEAWRRNVADLAAGMASSEMIVAVERVADSTDAMCDLLPAGGADVRRCGRPRVGWRMIFGSPRGIIAAVTSARTRLEQLRKLMTRYLPRSDEWVAALQERQSVVNGLLDEAIAKVEEAQRPQDAAHDRSRRRSWLASPALNK